MLRIRESKDCPAKRERKGRGRECPCGHSCAPSTQFQNIDEEYRLAFLKPLFNQCYPLYFLNKACALDYAPCVVQYWHRHHNVWPSNIGLVLVLY